MFGLNSSARAGLLSLCRRRAVSQATRPSGHRPRLELLEARTLLTTFTVDRYGDAGNGMGMSGDIRYCVSQMDAMSGQNNVVFDPRITLPIELTSGLGVGGPAGSSDTIDGGTAGVTIFGSASGQINGGILSIGGGYLATVTLVGLTLTGGTASNGGGAIDVGLISSLSLRDCTIRNCVAGVAGGAIYSDVTGATVALSRCTISNNRVTGNTPGAEGGGIDAIGLFLTLDNCVISNNTLVTPQRQRRRRDPRCRTGHPRGHQPDGYEQHGHQRQLSGRRQRWRRID
jgi:hypothetical protein